MTGVKKRHRLITTTTYIKSEQQETTTGPTEWLYVIPESVGDHLYNILCRDRADQERKPSQIIGERIEGSNLLSPD